MDFKIDRHLVVNLSHITKEDNDIFDDFGNRNLSLDIVRYDHGYIVSVPTKLSELKATLMTEGFSPYLYNILSFASILECHMITFDMEGYVYPEFPVFDWD
jgi:hypothetical protein